jgi:hypothetical protein
LVKAANAGGVCGGSGNNRIVSFDSLASGASATITIIARLDCVVVNGQIVGNTASVTSTTRDPVSGNNSSNVTFTVSKPPPVISPMSETYSAQGGDGGVIVTVPAGCGWQAVSNDAWIMITAGSTGTGNGSVAYHVAVNETGSPRVGTLTIAGLTFTVNQSNQNCSYSIFPLSASYSEAGGAGSVAVTAPAGCVWKASAMTPDIGFARHRHGVGNGSMSYRGDEPRLLPNRHDSHRRFTFTVYGAGAACPFSIAPTGRETRAAL